MDPRTNPYTPNAGARPQVLVGRDDQLELFDILLARLQRGRTEQSMIITGLRGVGKTVLLGQFRMKALEQRWVVVELEAQKHNDRDFRRDIAARMRTALFELAPGRKWSEGLKHAAQVLKNFNFTVSDTGSMSFGFDVDSLDGYADHGDLTMDLADLFIAVGEAAKENKRGVVLLFDEVQFLAADQLEALIQALHKCVQRELPITFVGAGLPQIAELAGDAKSYAERLFKFPNIKELSYMDAKQALKLPAEEEGVKFDEDALDRAVEISGAYPYFLQELGYAVWSIADGDNITIADIDQVIPRYESKLDESFFRVRLDRATELQRAYMRAMAELGAGPQKAADVAEVMGRSSQNLAPVRKSLIDMGLLYAPDHGYASFTVPHFDQFLKRAMPELVVPPVRSKKYK
ncbi:AAA family ATPase [Arcanobacterium bovis]|uniref:ATP-binding protein n=1 Tax=Arcanobacterium bovis TaxID=2529275 RepID=A0A4Q9UYY9_9ACTO|nr:ATP-binding protein [Arcanobacterium bovis]TBW20837.1 ATP-binding protein [Arcanobacterium bovis]